MRSIRTTVAVGNEAARNPRLLLFWRYAPDATFCGIISEREWRRNAGPLKKRDAPKFDGRGWKWAQAGEWFVLVLVLVLVFEVNGKPENEDEDENEDERRFPPPPNSPSFDHARTGPFFVFSA